MVPLPPDVIAPVLSRCVWCGFGPTILAAFKYRVHQGLQLDATPKVRLKTGADELKPEKTPWARRVFRPTDLQLRSDHTAAFTESPIRRFARSPIR
jgi:hypothetical protein